MATIIVAKSRKWDLPLLMAVNPRSLRLALGLLHSLNRYPLLRVPLKLKRGNFDMARKRVDLEVSDVLEAPDREDTQILNAADVEAEEAGLIVEPEAEIKTEADEPEAKPKRQRRSRAKSSDKSLDTAATPETLAAASSQNWEEMVKHWSTIRDISTTIAQNFEKLSGVLPKLPNDFVDTQELFRPKPQTTPFALKLATATSLTAALLSVLSLSLSQSARNAVLSQDVVARHSQTSFSQNSMPQSLSNAATSTAPEVAIAEQGKASTRAASPYAMRRKLETKENLFKVKK